MTELGAFFLPVLPLLFLLVALLMGRYPGCDAIVRLSERLAARSRAGRTAPASPGVPLRSRSAAPRGGLLIALGHPQRPPPLAA